MTTRADLHQAIRTTLASRRLGRPVFVRYLLSISAEPDTLLPTLARLATLVRYWLEQPMKRVYALGPVESGQLSVTLHFEDGATALVGLIPNSSLAGSADLLVLGNHGALYHDASNGEFWELEPPGEPAADLSLQAAIEQSLRSGKPVDVLAEGKP
jgi:hypothetical protein